jgi:hypothetical protein
MQPVHTGVWAPTNPIVAVALAACGATDWVQILCKCLALNVYRCKPRTCRTTTLSVTPDHLRCACRGVLVAVQRCIHVLKSNHIVGLQHFAGVAIKYSLC